jgi:hypothetical protein
MKKAFTLNKEAVIIVERKIKEPRAGYPIGALAKKVPLVHEISPFQLLGRTHCRQ